MAAYREIDSFHNVNFPNRPDEQNTAYKNER